MDTRRIDNYIKILKNRRAFLENKIDEKEEDKSHYLRAELLALNWVIAYIEDTSIEAAYHQYKWFNERVK